MKEKQTSPYKSGENGYNRKSGNKTLIFVGICIVLIIILTIISFFIIFNT